MSRDRVWIVSDYVRVEVGDWPEPSVVAVFDTPQLAHRVAAVLNEREHPAFMQGYRYDFRVHELDVYPESAEWTDADIVAAFPDV